MHILKQPGNYTCLISKYLHGSFKYEIFSGSARRMVNEAFFCKRLHYC